METTIETMTDEQLNREVLGGAYSIAKEEAKAAREAFIASLPVASDKQCKEYCAAVRSGEDRPKGVNSEFRFTEDQKAEVKAAEKDHRDFCFKNKDRLIAGTKTDTLVSFRVSVSAGGKTTKTARFESTPNKLALAELKKELVARRKAKS